MTRLRLIAWYVAFGIVYMAGGLLAHKLGRLIGWAIAAMLLVGCAPRPQAVEPVAASATPWCVSMRLTFDGKSESGRVCSSRLAVCQNVRSRAIQMGGLAKIEEVGQCKEER